jgi:hypothetical protein
LENATSIDSIIGTLVFYFKLPRWIWLERPMIDIVWHLKLLEKYLKGDNDG